MRHLITLIALFWAALSLGCQKHASPQMRDQLMSLGYMDADADGDSGGQPYAEMARAAPRAKRASRGEPASPPARAVAPDEAAPPDAPEQPARMVHYNGHTQLRVARPDETADAIRAIALNAGGRVERLSTTHITVRVPVAQFDALFTAIEALGDVLSRSISADDVTESFQAVELRLQTARTTRNRLVELLARAEDEKEKLALVREIQRLSEQIDRMENQSRTLAELANMSRITVSLVAREALAWQDADDETAEFAWVRALSPFHRDVVAAARPVKLNTPDGMVDLDAQGRRFIAESAGGARVWSGRIPNEPRGDAAFWLDVIERRLAHDFSTAEQQTMGDFRVLRLVSRDKDPYTWIIGVRVNGDRLELVEVYYPSAAEEERYTAPVAAAFGGGAA